ncbi:MAG: PD40 domain-containing protein [Bacteroidales bacterium]|nr:PD40 domain-containing protein [Bacteroidales bacterium]
MIIKQLSRNVHIMLVVALVATATLLFSGCRGAGPAGKKAFEIGEYDRAISKLSKAYAKPGLPRDVKGEYAFYLGECYRLRGQFKKASGYYKTAVRYKYSDDIALLYLGECQRATGDFEGARESFDTYLARHKNDPRARNGLQSIKMTEAQWDAITSFNPSAVPDSGYIVNLAKEFNSKYSDYSPAFVGDGYDVVYITSMRVAKRRRKMNRITGQGNSGIYMTKIDGQGKWTDPEHLEEPFANNIDDGTPSITSDGKTMYFTRCPYSETEPNTPQCFETTRSGGRWGEPVRVIPGGDSTMMVAHPAISPDGTTLYFVSDCDYPGAMGGKDIYRTRKTPSGDWSRAENLGALVNTRGDEMFPYIRSNGDLYFSSNGQPGFGGLDIYLAHLDERGIYRVSNMGLPINSSADDFGIIFKDNKEEGYLSSSRAGSKGIDNIYSFVLPPMILSMSGTVATADGTPPQKAFVRLIGSDGTNQKLTPDENGQFALVVDKDVDYIVLCGAEGCKNQKLKFSTQNKTKSETILLNVKLEKLEY